MPTKPNQNTAPAAAQAAESAANNGDFERLLVGPVSFGPRSMPEAESFSLRVSKSQLVPKDYQGRPDNVFAAIQWGAEIGLSPMQALQGIAIINGRPSLWGDVMLALVMNHPAYEWHREGGDDNAQWFEIKRRNQEPYKVPFSMDDAKKAGLAGKQGPWTNYPRRMMQMRARGFALRDKFPDALKGMISREEAMDYVDVATRGRTVAEKMQEDADYDAPQNRKTAQVYDATGTPVEAPEPVIGEKSETISQLIEELARIKGVAEKKVFDRFCKSYMAAWNTKEMPILIKIPELHYEWCLEQLDTWIQAAQPTVDVPEKISPDEYAMKASGGLPATSAADEL